MTSTNNIQPSFYSPEELAGLGLGAVGQNVRISRFARFYSPAKIFIGDHTRIDDFCIISGGSGVKIGRYVHVAAYSAIYGSQGVEIDDFANISSRVCIYSESDDHTGRTLTNPMIPAHFKTHQIQAPVKIGSHCIVFTNCTVLPGVTMDVGSVLGAHSLAKSNLEAWSIYVGVPAKKTRSRERALLDQVPLLEAGES